MFSRLSISPKRASCTVADGNRNAGRPVLPFPASGRCNTISPRSSDISAVPAAMQRRSRNRTGSGSIDGALLSHSSRTPFITLKMLPESRSSVATNSSKAGSSRRSSTTGRHGRLSFCPCRNRGRYPTWEYRAAHGTHTWRSGGYGIRCAACPGAQPHDRRSIAPFHRPVAGPAGKSGNLIPPGRRRKTAEIAIGNLHTGPKGAGKDDMSEGICNSFTNRN